MEVVGWLVITITAVWFSIVTIATIVFTLGMDSRWDNATLIPIAFAIGTWYLSITNFPFTITIN